MHILLTAATTFEILPTVDWLRDHAETFEENRLTFREVTVEVLFTGVGLTATAFALGHRLARLPVPALAIQAGIAGAFDRDLKPGTVVRVISETMGDLGAEERDGSLLSMDALGLPPGPPFDERGRLVSPTITDLPFPTAHGLTVNRVSGSPATIAARRERFPHAEIETMEGAAFFYACLQIGIEPLQLRAISNFVEPRNRDNWQMGLAIGALNDSLRGIVGSFIDR